MGNAWFKSDSSPSPYKSKRGMEKLDKYRLRRSYTSKRSDDDFAWHTKHRLPRIRNDIKLKSSNSRRSQDSYKDYHRKISNPQRHHHQSNYNMSVPRRSSSNSSDTDYSQRYKQPSSVIQKRKYNEKDSDVEFVEETRPKTYRRLAYERSGSKEFSNMNYFYDKSSKYLKEGRLKKALNCINLALRLSTEENEFVSKIYTRRGVIYSLLEKPACSFQGFLDFEHAFIIDKDNIEARKNMSKALFMGGNMLFRMKVYDKALNICKHALDLDEKNGEASILSKVLKRKIIEKERKKKMAATVANKSKKASLFQISEVKRNPEKSLTPVSKRDTLVIKEVKRLNSMIKESLRNNNNEQALHYINKALRIFKKDIPDDTVYRKLLLLRQHIMN